MVTSREILLNQHSAAENMGVPFPSGAVEAVPQVVSRIDETKLSRKPVPDRGV